MALEQSKVLLMINNDQELQVTQARILQYQQWLGHMRQSARPEEFEAVTSGSRLAIERMQAEVLDYLLRPLTVEPDNQTV